MKYTTVTNPAWANVEHTTIICDVNFDDLPEETVPFTAVASGDYPHTHEIFARCVAGEFGSIAEYAPPTTEQLAATARLKRNARLAETDWTQATDVPQATKDLWTTYRQALRDLPEQSGFPADVVWPVKP
jgi:DMSO/TMAO reductase YedYZ molybdopterin-dependent catalytic subunit